jgi:glutaredoxin 3
MAHVLLYTTSSCPFCLRAKQLLDRKKIAYEEIDVTNDTVLRDKMVADSGRRTVPQIFINGQPIGGSDDLYALDKEGKLDILLSD